MEMKRWGVSLMIDCRLVALCFESCAFGALYLNEFPRLLSLRWGTKETGEGVLLSAAFRDFIWGDTIKGRK